MCSLLKEHGITYIAVDHDASGVARDRREGHGVYYGDASDLRFLEKCGLRKANGLVITIHSQAAIDKVVDGVRAIRPDVLIVSRARDADHARHLYAIGATDAVPETIEASLQLSEAALVDWALPPDARLPRCTKRGTNFAAHCSKQPGPWGVKTAICSDRKLTNLARPNHREAVSALGHKQTCAAQTGMSALALKADVCGATSDVR